MMLLSEALSYGTVWRIKFASSCVQIVARQIFRDTKIMLDPIGGNIGGKI